MSEMVGTGATLGQAFGSAAGGVSAQQQKALALREQFDRDVAAITGQRDLTVDAKQRRVAKLWSTLKDQVAGLQKAENDERARTQQQLERDLFGFNPDANPLVAISMRDAQDRASRVEKYEDARDLMAKAVRAGDTQLARATLLTSVERGYRPVVEQFTAAFPDQADNVVKLAASANNKSNTAAMVARGLNYSAAVARPSELAHVSDAAVDRMIAEPTG